MFQQASRSAVLVALLFAAGVAAIAHARQPALEVMRLDGQTEVGSLVRLVPEVSLEVAGGVISLPWSEILAIRPSDASPSSQPSTANPQPLQATLADGSVLAGEVTAGDQYGFIFRFGEGEECRLELSQVCVIRALAASAAAEQKLSELLRLRKDQPGAEPAEDHVTDVAVVARGSEVLVLNGRILEVQPQQVAFEWKGTQRPIPWNRLGGLIFARPELRRAPCIVRLNTGDAIAGQVVGGASGVLKLRMAVLERELDIPWASVERVDCRSERLVVLSDLQPAGYEFEPFFDKNWNYAVDRTLTGRQIRLGGRAFARGLSMHSRARLVYQLDGQFERFAATAGILDEMGGRGCVTLRVRGDGRVLWSATGVRGGEPPRDVSVDIAGVRELSLEVDYDADLDLSDQAAWGFARLIR